MADNSAQGGIPILTPWFWNIYMHGFFGYVYLCTNMIIIFLIDNLCLKKTTSQYCIQKYKHYQTQLVLAELQPYPTFHPVSGTLWQLARNVQRMAATHFSFAAICGDGSVVTWGRQACGDSFAVQEQLAGL